MSSTAAIDNLTGSATATSGQVSRALSSQDFLKIMITELTNQDPLEPMKNQDLLNQMASIQQLDSNQAMTKSFERLMGRFDNLLLREQISSAAGMVGSLVSGYTPDGSVAFGKVIGLTILDDTVALRLDTGDSIYMEDVDSIGGREAANIVGSVVMGPSADGSRIIVGRVRSVTVDGATATLILEPKPDPDDPDTLLTQTIPLADATLLNQENSALLIGRHVKGFDPDGNPVQGVVRSYSLSQDENADTVISVFIETNDTENNEIEVRLSDLTEIINTDA